MMIPQDASAIERKRSADFFTRENKITNDHGETKTKTVKGVVDRENKTLTRDVTGYNGDQRQTTTTLDRDNKTLSTQGSNGASRTTSVKDGTKTTTTKGPGGKSVTKETVIKRKPPQ